MAAFERYILVKATALFIIPEMLVDILDELKNMVASHGCSSDLFEVGVDHSPTCLSADRKDFFVNFDINGLQNCEDYQQMMVVHREAG